MASEHCAYRLDSECCLLYSREQQESICSQQLLTDKDNRLNAQENLKARLALCSLSCPSLLLLLTFEPT
jgi:hypothetical protein